jgi:hypothetical protein
VFLCVLVCELGHADVLPTMFLRNVTGHLNLSRDVTKASALSSSPPSPPHHAHLSCSTFLLFQRQAAVFQRSTEIEMTFQNKVGAPVQ